MIYSSLLFIYVFFPLSLLIYYATPKKHRNISLLVLSMAFCGTFGAAFLIFMTAYTALNFTSCRLIEKYRENKGLSRSVLILALVLDISALFIFRCDFFTGYRETLFIPEAFFPVGISFFTLSAAGTLADVYCGRMEAEKNIIFYGLYIMFFPRLIMGPLLRYSSFRKMLCSRNDGLSEIGTGFAVFARGFAKKVIAADSLYALYSAAISVGVDKMAALTAWLGVVSYFLCLYFTISGISDMGTGIGYCFGFRMPQSFNYPVFSSNVRYFAARWHMQAVQWFRRYITKPLSSLSENRIYKKAVFIVVWGLLGFWYKFNISGFVSGMILGSAVIVESRFSREKLLPVTGILYTFIITLVCSELIASGDLAYSLKYFFAMVGGNRIVADSHSLYLLKSYILILLISMYASTNLFRNLMLRSGRIRVRNIVTVMSPLAVLSVMILCTILISYRGSSEIILLQM